METWADASKTVGLMTDQGRRAEPRRPELCGEAGRFPGLSILPRQTPARSLSSEEEQAGAEGLEVWGHRASAGTSCHWLRDRQQLRKPRSLHSPPVASQEGTSDDHAHHFVPASDLGPTGGSRTCPQPSQGPLLAPRPVSPGSQPPSGTPELSLFPQRSCPYTENILTH